MEDGLARGDGGLDEDVLRERGIEDGGVAGDDAVGEHRVDGLVREQAPRLDDPRERLVHLRQVRPLALVHGDPGRARRALSRSLQRLLLLLWGRGRGSRGRRGGEGREEDVGELDVVDGVLDLGQREERVVGDDGVEDVRAARHDEGLRRLRARRAGGRGAQRHGHGGRGARTAREDCACACACARLCEGGRCAARELRRAHCCHGERCWWWLHALQALHRAQRQLHAELPLADERPVKPHKACECLITGVLKGAVVNNFILYSVCRCAVNGGSLRLEREKRNASGWCCAFF